MRVGFIANLKDDVPPNDRHPPGDDYWDDLDDQAVVDSVLEALEKLGHDAQYIKPDDNIIETLRDYSPDIVFNYAEGHFASSREAQVPAILDMLRIPYTGSGVLGMALCHDKVFTKKIIRCAGFKTPDYFALNHPDDLPKIDMTFPLFVKPSHQGSSVGINDDALVNTKSELSDQVSWLWKKIYEPILIEEYIPGREFTVVIVNNEVFPLVEHISPIGFYSKAYKGEKRDEMGKICPVDLDASIHEEIIEACKGSFHALNMYDWGRFDVRMDNSGQYFILEVNPITTLTRDGSFAKSAWQAGYSYEDVIEIILQSAIKRFRLTNTTQRYV